MGLHQIGFWDGIQLNRGSKQFQDLRLLELTSGYFPFGKQYNVVALNQASGTVKKYNVSLSPSNDLRKQSSYLKTIFIVLSYFTIVIPAIVFAVHIFERRRYHFYDANIQYRGGNQENSYTDPQIRVEERFSRTHRSSPNNIRQEPRKEVRKPQEIRREKREVRQPKPEPTRIESERKIPVIERRPTTHRQDIKERERNIQEIENRRRVNREERSNIERKFERDTAPLLDHQRKLREEISRRENLKTN